jgi:hypothetical protein
MGVLGLAYLVFRPGTGALEAFGWVWPIALFALVVWMLIQSRRSLRSWSRPVILYPLFAVLALAAVGGGYQTVRDTQDRSAYAMPGQLVDVGDTSCTSTAPVPAPRPSSLRPASASRPR